jgi:hypothetical protein
MVVASKPPLVLAAPRSTTNLGRAADLSARMVDSYLLTSHDSTSTPDLAGFWIHGVFLPDSTVRVFDVHRVLRVFVIEAGVSRSTR